MTGLLEIPCSICRSGKCETYLRYNSWVRTGSASQTLLTGVGLRLGRRLGTPYVNILWSIIKNSFIFSCSFPLLIPQIYFFYYYHLCRLNAKKEKKISLRLTKSKGWKTCSAVKLTKSQIIIWKESPSRSTSGGTTLVWPLTDIAMKITRLSNPTIASWSNVWRKP